MKYELSVKNELVGSIKFIREYPQNDFKKLLDANTDLEKYLDFDRAWRILYVNMKTQKNFLENLMKEGISKEIWFNYEQLEIIRRALNIDLFNVLSAFYFFCYMFCQKSFHRWFGKDSSELSFLESKRKEYFDKYFEFRFFYRLRNFSVHGGIPIQLLFNTYGENGEVLFVAGFDIKFLLIDHDWGNVVTNDLKQKKEEFIPLASAIIEFSKIALEFHKEVHAYLLNKFSDSVGYIKSELQPYLDDYTKLSIWEHQGPISINEKFKKGEKFEFVEHPINTIVLKSI